LENGKVGLVLLAKDDAVAELLHAIVRGLNRSVLTADHTACYRIEVFVQSLAIGFNGGVFAAFAFSQNGVWLIRGDSGFQVDPAAVQRTSHAAGVAAITAEAADAVLKFGDEGGTLRRKFSEDAGKLTVLRVFCGRLETVLAVFIRF